MNGSLRFGPPTLSKIDCTKCGEKDQLHVKGKCNHCGHIPESARWRYTTFGRERAVGKWEAKR